VLLSRPTAGRVGNPGPAGYGAVVWSADRGTVLAEGKQAIERATNNVAEYRGLIAGLEEAAKLGATDVAVSMDSKLVVEQMSGRWKVKHPDLAVLHQQATALSTRFDHITYTWIPRAKKQPRRPAGQRGDGRRRRNRGPRRDTEGKRRRHQQLRHPRAGPERVARPPGSCCCATARPSLSVQRRYSGRGNPALTDLGRRQAEGRRTVSRAEGWHRGSHHLAPAARV